LILLESFLAASATTARAQWHVDGAPVCTAENSQDTPTSVPDGAGGAILTWEDLRGGSSHDIYAQHVLASGTVDPAWPVDGRALCTASNDQSGARIVSDGAGGAIVTWHDTRGSNYHIYSQHVLASGVVDAAWPVNGVAVCTAPFLQLYPEIVTDGSGGAIITWNDSRTGSFDIYAQRVKASGIVEPLWPADGQSL